MTPEEHSPLTERQSLDLIQTMIRQAQGRFSQDGSHYLMWGWLVLIASLTNYLLLKAGYAEYGSLAWLLMPLGGMGAWLLSRREARQSRPRTYVDRVMSYLWGGVGITLFLTFFLLNTHIGSSDNAPPVWNLSTYPVVLLLYGLGLFTSGGLLRIPALIAGAVVCWLLAIVSNFQPFDNQLLCLAGAMLAGYIVPGFILRARFRAENAAPSTPLANATHAL